MFAALGLELAGSGVSAKSRRHLDGRQALLSAMLESGALGDFAASLGSHLAQSELN